MTPAEFPFIREAVCSALTQTNPCKVILFVSESNDSIERVLGEVAARIDIRRVPLRPVGLIRNQGVEAAQTEWIGFLDGDDVWEPNKIERQLAHASKSHASAIGCRHLLIREDGRAYFYGFARRAPMPSTFLVKRELLRREPFSDAPQWEDVELWRRLQRLGTAVTLREHLLLYRVRDVSLSTSYSPAKRRKYLFCRLSRFPALRFLLLAGSWIGAQLLSSK